MSAGISHGRAADRVVRGVLVAVVLGLAAALVATGVAFYRPDRAQGGGEIAAH